MLESLVAGLLNRFLGAYVENFDPKQLNIGIWNGDVKLVNLRLKKEALEKFRLPIDVVDGHLGEMTLQIPWSNLRGKPVRVLIKDIFLISSTVSDTDEVDPEEEKARQHMLKMERLDSAEILHQETNMADDTKGKSFTDSLVTKIVDNLQITIQNIHIRYEDKSSVSELPFAIGFTLAELSAVSTDENWQPTFIQNDVNVINKLATLGSMTVYYRTNSEMLQDTEDRAQAVEKMRKQIATNDSISDEHDQLVLRPVSGTGRLALSKHVIDQDTPKSSAQLLFDEFALALDDEQYATALRLADHFHLLMRRQQYRHLRPKDCTPSENPRKWFKYAGQAIVDEIHARAYQWSWANFAKRRDERLAYVALFKKKSTGKIAPTEDTELSQLEWDLSYQDIRFYRSIARMQLRKEKVKQMPVVSQAAQDMEPSEQNASQDAATQKAAANKGWVSWMWSNVGYGGSSPADKQDTVMNEEQRKELYQAIEWDEKSAMMGSLDTSQLETKLKLKTLLNKGSFGLVRRNKDGSSNPVLTLQFETLASDILQKTDSVKTSLSLQSMKIVDGTQKNPIYQQIVQVLGRETLKPNEDDEASTLDKGEASDDMDAFEKLDQIRDPLFHAVVETNPPDSDADSRVIIGLKPMQILYNPRYVEQVVSFFRPPASELESISTLVAIANSTVQELTSYTRAGLEFALEEHKQVDVQLDMQAPLILVPENCNVSDTTCLVFDAGHISMSSNLTSKDTIDEIQKKQKQLYTKEDFEKLKSLMYDRFTLHLQSMQLLLSPSVAGVISKMSSEEYNRNRILGPINVDLELEISMLPKMSLLTRFQVKGHLPKLHASISDAQYKALMRIIDSAVPKFEDTSRSKDEEKALSRSLNRRSTANARAQSTSMSTAIPHTFLFGQQDDVIVPSETGSSDVSNKGNGSDKSDENSKSNEDDGDSDDGDDDDNLEFEEANEGSLNSVLQTKFKFIFTVGQLQGSLFRADRQSDNENLLVELYLNDFKIDFDLKENEMNADVTLQDLLMEDHISKDINPEFRNMISSSSPGSHVSASTELAADKKADDAKPLVSVKFAKVGEKSPNYMTKYEGIETNLDVELSAINAVITSATVLALLDFIMATFSPSNNSTTKLADDTEDYDPGESDALSRSETVSKTRVKVELNGVNLILNHDGLRLATLSLSHVNAAIFLMGPTIRIGAKVGNLVLTDDLNSGVTSTSMYRQLVSIEGDQLADFRFETFDKDHSDYMDCDSSIYLHTGVLRVNVVEDPWQKILEFASKLIKLKNVYDSARSAAVNRASEIQDRAGKVKFDINLRAPKFVFPRIASTETKSDYIILNPGELYAISTFSTETSDPKSPVVNEVRAGVRSIRLESRIHNTNPQLSESMEIMKNVDIGFHISYCASPLDKRRPALNISGNMSDISIRLTDAQYAFLIEISRSVPRIFEGFSNGDDSLDDDEVKSITSNMASLSTSGVFEPGIKEDDSSTDLYPEIKSATNSKVEFVFKIQDVDLEIFRLPEQSTVKFDLESASLSKFCLTKIFAKAKVLNDGSMESELQVKSFTIYDSRHSKDTVFRNIVPSIPNDGTQFMASMSMSPGTKKTALVIISVDSPTVVFSLEHIFQLKDFAAAPFAALDQLEKEKEEIISTPDETSSVTQDSMSRSDMSSALAATSQNMDEAGFTLNYRVNIADCSVYLLADSKDPETSAILLTVKDVLISRQRVSAMAINSVGMYLCRMNNTESRLRLLDDIDMTCTIESRNANDSSFLTNIQIDIEPLVLRLSLRDILLVSNIVNRAIELSSSSSNSEDTEDSKAERKPHGSSVASKLKSSYSAKSYKPLTVYDGKGARQSSLKTARTDRLQYDNTTSVVLRREILTASIKGFRVVLIGDLQCLPIFDFNVDPFTINVTDWSSELHMNTDISTYIDVYNFFNSHWEPLIEPWQFGLHLNRSAISGKTGAKLSSRKRAEITVTSSLIETVTSLSEHLNDPHSDFMEKPRGSVPHFRIKNMTGYNISVWADNDSAENDEARMIQDGKQIDWSFEDWTVMRNTLKTDANRHRIGFKLMDTDFESVTGVFVNSVREILVVLRPKKDILHRVCVTIELGKDHVKTITIRSPLFLQNSLQIPIEAVICDHEGRPKSKVQKIAPNEGCSFPIEAAYAYPIRVRPNPDLGYTWSYHTLFWRDFIKEPSRAVTCKSLQADTTPFNIRVQATFDSEDPLTKVYPYMRLEAFPPLEIQNLLPYDFDVRIFEKGTKKDWNAHLAQGSMVPVHVVNLSNVVLLGVTLRGTPFKPSSFAIINATNPEEYRREATLSLNDASGTKLTLNLHYMDLGKLGGSFRVSVYCQHIILNKTGELIEMRSKSFLQASKSCAGQTEFSRNAPYLFAYDTEDQRNRALIKVGDSQWSKPQSFEAIGSYYQLSVLSADGKNESFFGVSIEEGEGKYKLTKVITITPRFLVKNNMDHDIDVRLRGTSNIQTLKKDSICALHTLRVDTKKQASLCYPGLNNEWSAPFNIEDLGRVHVKIARPGERQNLVRVDILVEKATLFIHLNPETKSWPFSVRNESDETFLFWQSNPYASEDFDRKSRESAASYHAKRYRLPPRSVMPYAWDYPAASNKELVLSCKNHERSVRPNEIGNFPPLKVTDERGSSKYLSLDVVGDGPTQRVVLRNFRKSDTVYRLPQARKDASGTDESNNFEIADIRDEVKLEADIDFEGLGVSLINRRLQELAYLTLRGFNLKYFDSELYQTLSLKIKWVQIDNQLYGGFYPIVLYPSVVPKNGKDMEIHPILSASITRVKDDSHGVVYIKYASILLQELTLEMDEDFLFALLDFTKTSKTEVEENEEGKLFEPDSSELPQPTTYSSDQELYFEVLHLQPVQLNISFVRTERVNVEDKTSSKNFVMFFLNILTMAIGNINDAPVRLNAMLIENVRVTGPMLMQQIGPHYAQEFIYQIHKIIGSADLIGNPVGLFNNISSGVADIFYEPYQGFVMTDRPRELGFGIARGTASFVKKTVFGLSDSFSKVTGSLSKGLSAATMDQGYQDRRRITRVRNRPKHALFGVTTGADSFMTSVASGIEGVARQPLEGLQTGGAAGFFKGIGKGMVGFATKPVIGVLDLASNVAEGIRNTTTVFDTDGIDKVRLARHIGRDGVVRPYSQREALGQFWLKQLDSGKYFKEDYLAHLPVLNECVVILTYDRIMLVKSKSLQTEWQVSFEDVQTLSMEKTGIAIILRGGLRGPFVPIEQGSGRKFLFNKLQVAVNNYNLRRRPVM